MQVNVNVKMPASSQSSASTLSEDEQQLLRQNKLDRSGVPLADPVHKDAYDPEKNKEADDRERAEKLRLDRNLGELLQELRVVMPGVQVIFGFLLAVPFQQTFQKIDTFEKRTYFSVLLCTALSVVLLMSPPVFHRLTFHKHQKKRLVYYGNRIVIVGLFFEALAMAGAMILVTHILFGYETTLVVGLIFVCLLLVLWVLFPVQALYKAVKEGTKS